jgi:hypothetical protein
MFRALLLASVLTILANASLAEQLKVPGLSPEAPATLDLPACENTRDDNNCARVLACFGLQGVYFDGQARGWGRGTLAGQRNDGVVCGGTWEAGTGPWGSGVARFRCEDGTQGQVMYFTQDPETGTAIGRGMDSTGRHIKGWSGHNVLEFLGEGDALNAELPCSTVPIPIS